MKKRIKDYVNSLNWEGFLFMIILCALGLGSNESVTSIGIWALMMLILGLPLSLLVLIGFRK